MWLAGLIGEPKSLELLAKQDPDPEWFVRRDHRHDYVLGGNIFDGASSDEEVRRIAEGWLKLTKLALFAAQGIIDQRLGLANVIRRASDGPDVIDVRVADTLHICAVLDTVIVKSDGTVVRSSPPPTPNVRAKRALVAKDANVRIAIEIAMSAGPNDWAKLYNIVEVIAKDLSPLANSISPGYDIIISSYGVSQADLDRFKENANKPEHTGINSRHQKPGGPRRHGYMPWDEAYTLVHKLLDDWVASKH